jgi:hypothetical protein
MSKLTQAKFDTAVENFPEEWSKEDHDGLVAELKSALAEFEFHYMFHKCFFHDDELHIVVFSGGNSFVLTVKLVEEKKEKTPPEMKKPMPAKAQPWWIRMWG